MDLEKAEDEEEDSPALLTTKMIPLLREVRKGELVLQALVAVAGKETVLLLSRVAREGASGAHLSTQGPAGGHMAVRAGAASKGRRRSPRP